MKRYQFLGKRAVLEALNNLRNAFLAAKDGHEVDELILSILSEDERLKIGRRIEIAYMLSTNSTIEEIVQQLQVGRSTIIQVEKLLDAHPQGFALISRRENKVESTYKDKAWVNEGGSKLVFKRRRSTGFQRNDVQR